MAFGYIHFNDQTAHGRLLRGALTRNENADDDLADARSVMIQMRDGADNPSDSSNYAELVRRFGFGDYTTTQGNPTSTQCDLARAAFLEVDTAYALTQDAQAARNQLYAKLRG